MHIFPAWAQALGSLLTGLAAIIAGWTALHSIGAWRREAVGRRKTELAEEVLAQFYRARDALVWARFPHPDAFEEASRAGEEDDAREARRREALSTPVERLSREMGLFSELQASRYRVMAIFGEAAAHPFDEIMAARDDVVSCAGALIRSSAEEEATPEMEAMRDKLEVGVGWTMAHDDPVTRRVDEAIRAIERICRPLIDEAHRPAGALRRRG